MYLNNYVYYTGKIILNDREIPLKKDYIYYCIDYDDYLYDGTYGLYLLRNVLSSGILLWALDSELVLIPPVSQKSLEIIYGCKTRG